MKTITTLLLLISLNAEAFCYLDLAVSANDSGDDIYVAKGSYAVKWEAPFLSAELGCTIDDFTGAIRHTSSFKQDDRGFNVIEVRYRAFVW